MSRQWLTAGLPVLVFFLLTVWWFPVESTYEAPGSVQLVLSLTLFSLSTLWLFLAPRQGMAFITGIIPLVEPLVNASALYSFGVTLFYLLASVVLLVRLPKVSGPPVRLRGMVFLLSLGIIMLLWGYYAQNWQSHMMYLSGYIGFLLYFGMLRHRIDQGALEGMLVAFFVGSFLVMAWLLAVSDPDWIMWYRLGELQGQNPNQVAYICLLNIMSMGYLLILHNRRFGVGHLLYSILVLVALFLTGSRIAYLQLLAVILFFGYKVPVRRAVFGYALLLLLVSLPLMQIYFGNLRVVTSVFERMGDILGGSTQVMRFSNTEDRPNIRVELEVLSWEVAFDNPVFGVGPHEFPRITERRGLATKGVGIISHNILSGTAAQFGFIGFSLLVLWMLSFPFSGCRHRGLSAYILVAVTFFYGMGVTHAVYFFKYLQSIVVLWALTMERIETAKSMEETYEAPPVVLPPPGA